MIIQLGSDGRLVQTTTGIQIQIQSQLQRKPHIHLVHRVSTPIIYLYYIYFFTAVLDVILGKSVEL